MNGDKWKLAWWGWVPVPQKRDQFKIPAVTWRIDFWKKLSAKEVWAEVYLGGGERKRQKKEIRSWATELFDYSRQPQPLLNFYFKFQ